MVEAQFAVPSGDRFNRAAAEPRSTARPHMKLLAVRVITEAPEGVEAAVSEVLSRTWQRCRAHFMRKGLAHAGKISRRVVSDFAPRRLCPRRRRDRPR
jgi:hypothetical protein